MKIHKQIIIFSFTLILANCSNEKSVLVLTDETSDYILKAHQVKNKVFLEHEYSWENQAATAKVIATKGGTGNIYQSDNLGKSYSTVYLSLHERWEGCLSLNSGKHLLWDNNSSMIWRFDAGWNLIDQVKTGDYPWHGNWSIAEYNNVIMYAEYAGSAKKLNVWRSTDDGQNWDIVFTKLSRDNDNHEIRHFHTLQPDPFEESSWYLSSGDASHECMIWKSVDHGLSWTEVTDPAYKGNTMQKVFRFTALYFDPTHIYWGTDDLMLGNTLFIKASKTEPLQIEIVTELDNVIRSATKTNFGSVLISETGGKRNDTFIDFNIYLIDNDLNTFSLYNEPGTESEKTGFNYSRASISAKDNIFFSYANGKAVFAGKSGMIKWEIAKK